MPSGLPRVARDLGPRAELRASGRTLEDGPRKGFARRRSAQVSRHRIEPVPIEAGVRAADREYAAVAKPRELDGHQRSPASSDQPRTVTIAEPRHVGTRGPEIPYAESRVGLLDHRDAGLGPFDTLSRRDASAKDRIGIEQPREAMLQGVRVHVPIEHPCALDQPSQSELVDRCERPARGRRGRRGRANQLVVGFRHVVER